MNPAVVNKNSDLFENFLRKWLISQPFSDRQLNPGTLGFYLDDFPVTADTIHL